MSKRDVLLLKQQAAIAALQAELTEHINSGNEYYASLVRDEIIVASSLARLIHSALK